MNTRRMNRLEELGRVDAEKAFTKKGARNLKDEKKRIVRELKATGGYITKKEKPKYITRKKPEGKLLPEGGSKYIQRKAKPEGGSKYIKRKPQYITKKKKYITKKTPEQIREREMVRSSRGYEMGGKVKDPADKRPMATRKRKMSDAQRPKSRQGLKPVRPEQKGLKKLPTKVRNKMGYMKKGGRVGMGKALRGGGRVR